jgi:hypothetical protein
MNPLESKRYNSWLAGPGTFPEHSFPAPLGPGVFVGVQRWICLVLRDGKRERLALIGSLLYPFRTTSADLGLRHA